MSSFWRFILATIFFTVLIAAFNRAQAPTDYYSSYDSSSIQNQELLVPVKKASKRLTPPLSVAPVQQASSWVIMSTSASQPDRKQINTAPSISSIPAMVQALYNTPYFHTLIADSEVVVDENLTDKRWETRDHVVHLRSTLGLDEATKVLTHELGHIVDLYYFPRTSTGDISDTFAAFCWSSPMVKIKGVTLGDFVSGYALSNRYEDFAETFTFYVFHNTTFRERAKKSQILAQKYAFFRMHVFPQGEFVGTAFELANIPDYVWDTTKISISIEKYLAFIKN